MTLYLAWEELVKVSEKVQVCCECKHVSGVLKMVGVGLFGQAPLG